jgi:VanZ family protein
MATARPNILLPLAVAGTVAVTMLPVSGLDRLPLVQHLMDAGHLVLFAALTGITLRALSATKGNEGWSAVVAVIMSMALAVFIELVQPILGRTGSVRDLVNGWAGAALAGTGIWVWRSGGAIGFRILHLFVALAVVAFVLNPVLLCWNATRWRASRFPVLGGFENDVELRLWHPQGGRRPPTQIQAVAEHASEGQRSLEVKTATGDWAGVNYDAGDLNWSGNSALAFDVFNPGPNFTLNTRIDDDSACDHPACWSTLRREIRPGWNRVSISTGEIERAPAERRLNMAAIRCLVLFTGRDQPGRVFFLDNVRLE